VTTRDIDRGDAAHFLLKEISESPDSLAKTLRGRIATTDGHVRAVVGERALPTDIAERLAAGLFRRIKVIGQGTAAVAGRAVAVALGELLDGDLAVEALTATELSGFGLQLDMSDTLAIAVSQSGTTTDTNRTVDLLKARGAAVLAIVNRRSSDLTDKADGVLYTSDGRDVEMSVASTKAFYAQVAAGILLACAISEAAGLPTEKRRHELLSSLRALPEAMRDVLARRPTIAETARRYAPTKRYWAVVGNGVNKVAAEELRIKLSELCYKAIACDVTEDKKHIDLSSEPLIFVCAAGLAGSTADDVGKEVAIFRAHKATPIVVADDGDNRYPGVATIPVPPIDPALAFVLSTMAGHLFGYEAALAIDASAIPLREAREIIERAVGGTASADAMLNRVRAAIGRPAEQYLDGLRNSRYDGQLEASTAVRLAGLLRDVRSEYPVEEYQLESGKVGSPAALLEDLVAALTQAIEELTRPVDAIKHQAKTVTVGISRSDEGVLDRPLVQAVLAAGAGRDVLSYKTLKVLADLDPAVAEVIGFTRYGLDGDMITVVDRGGLSMGLTSRVERRPVLSGTKRTVATQREVLVARGRSDGRTVIFVPEAKANLATGITLLHVRFHERLDAATMRGVLQGYDRRYDRLVDWVSETEGAFDERLLGQLPVADLLIEPISETANRWRA
jgi:glutamine---fructose-6-phosphate transaminase (isomerizing)